MRIWLLLVCSVMWAQDPELGRVERSAKGTRATLIADGLRHVGAANTTLPVRYRLEGKSFVAESSILDRRVTVPTGKRTVSASADLMVQDLARQTGARVHCCQGFVGGIPWGMREVEFGAKAEMARTVLQRLIDAEGGRMQWLVRCDASKPAWCFINLIHVPRPGDILR